MELIQLIKALGDDTRIRILNLLRRGELCVCEIEYILGLTQSNASRHLTKLSLAGLIKSEKKAQWVYYGLNEKVLMKYPFLEQLFNEEFDKVEKLSEDLEKFKAFRNSGKGCADLK